MCESENGREYSRTRKKDNKNDKQRERGRERETRAKRGSFCTFLTSDLQICGVSQD